MKKERSIICIENGFSKQILEDIYYKYLNIKKNHEYRLYYKIFFELESLRDNADIIYERKKSLDTDFKETIDLLNKKIKNEWGLIIPISPYLKLRWDDLHSPLIKSNSPLAKLVYSFGISSNTSLLPLKHRKRRLTQLNLSFALWLSKKPKKVTVSTKTLERDKKVIKYVCYLLVYNLNVKNRRVGRIFNIDKATVRRWVDEVKSWSVDEMEAMRCNLTRTKYFPKEPYNMYYNKIPLSKMEYKLTTDGIYESGRKRRCKPLSQLEKERLQPPQKHHS
jgi:hypothetical protein